MHVRLHLSGRLSFFLNPLVRVHRHFGNVSEGIGSLKALARLPLFAYGSRRAFSVGPQPILGVTRSFTALHDRIRHRRHHTTGSLRDTNMDVNREVNGEANGIERRAKRKESPVFVANGPSKRLRPRFPIMDEVETPENGQPDQYSSEEDIPMPAIAAAAAADTPEWQATIEKVVKMVVSIHFCQTHAFDTDAALSSEATGFVVDAEKGYIMTNRHVVGAGPFWGYCIFDNHEEVSKDERYLLLGESLSL